MEDWKQLERLEGQMTTLISIHCFHWLRDQKEAFEHVKKLLKPNGVACLLFPPQATFFDAVEDIKVHPKRKDILMDVDDRIPESHKKKWDSKHYLDIVQELGFEIVRCESRSIRDVAISDDHYKLFLSSLCVILESIPESKREEFQQDFFEELLKKNGCTGERQLPFHEGCMLDSIIKKPASEMTEPELPFSTTIDEAVYMPADDELPIVQRRMPPVMVSTEEQDVKLITNLIGSEFGTRLILKLSVKYMKCTALDNEDLIQFIKINELNFFKTTPNR
ncbi:hypothetical protein CEXT_309431 [Caerostris extrusa]|uniref:Methyltransferase type 11 domain-containing protein n=1 Tax=Caerostris extrusa TaxID=172846 RepID=A0AAV4WXR9_CAEEX|nr:hypothetical protein CEXT_309431 [Caerostris extrusa]